MKTYSEETLESWFEHGTRLSVKIPGKEQHPSQEVTLFCRVEGTGPWLTLLHGFPTCSWDWHHIAEPLSQQYRLLLVDLLGYGDSEKPKNHCYTSFEHADIIEALWQHFGIKQTGIIAHDVGSTITQELLARQKEGLLQAEINAAVLLNGAVYTDHYHPVLITQLMRQPLLGPVIVRALSERSFTSSLSRFFSEQHPLSRIDAHQYWMAMQRHQGTRIMHRLLHYIVEKKIYKQRWENALENQFASLHFLWGMADPATGAQIAEDIRRHIPSADLVAYQGIGHFPHLEIPEQVVQDIRTAFQ